MYKNRAEQSEKTAKRLFQEMRLQSHSKKEPNVRTSLWATFFLSFENMSELAEAHWVWETIAYQRAHPHENVCPGINGSDFSYSSLPSGETGVKHASCHLIMSEVCVSC